MSSAVTPPPPSTCLCQSQARTRWQATGAASSLWQASLFLIVSVLWVWFSQPWRFIWRRAVMKLSPFAWTLPLCVCVFNTLTQCVLPVYWGPMQRSSSPSPWGGYLHTSWWERLSKTTLNLWQNSTVTSSSPGFLSPHCWSDSLPISLFFSVYEQGACTVTPSPLSATCRISQICQSGSASPRGISMITASCTARQHLRGKTWLRCDAILPTRNLTSYSSHSEFQVSF